VALSSAPRVYAQSPSGFETFVVSKEARAEITKLDAGSLAPPARPSGPPLFAATRLTPARDRLTAQAALTLFPGMNDLSVNLFGELHGRTVEGRVSPLRWFEGGYSNPGYLQLTRGSQGLRIGDDYSELLGSAQGLRLFTPWQGGQGMLGLGLYQRLRDGYSSMLLTPAADTQWRVQPGVNVGALVAADSSVRLTQQVHGKGWQAYGFQGHDAGTNRPEAGLLLEGRPTHRTSVYNRVVGWGGGLSGYQWSVGATQQLGQSMLSVDRSATSMNQGGMSQVGVGAFIPIRTQSLFLRWYTGRVDGTNGTSTATSKHFDAFNGTLFSTLDTKTAIWTTGSGFWQQGLRPQTYFSLGASRILSNLWSVQAEFAQRVEHADARVRLSLGYQISHDSQVRLLFGPSLAPSATGRTDHTVGLQLIRSVSYAQRHTGSITGRVVQDGRPCERKLTLMLDGEKSVETDAQGRFKIGRVPVGDHIVELGLSALPADLSPVQPAVRVGVARGKSADVAFEIRRVGQIRGVVRVGEDEFGHQDPTAGIGVTIGISDDLQTTTNAEAEFILGNVPPGTHTVALNTDTLPPDFEVVGGGIVTVQVDPRKPVPVVEFRVAPRAKKIDFGTAPPIEPAPTPAPPTPKEPAQTPSGIDILSYAIAPGSARLYAEPWPASPTVDIETGLPMETYGASIWGQLCPASTATFDPDLSSDHKTKPKPTAGPASVKRMTRKVPAKAPASGRSVDGARLPQRIK
jgi:hypothetical protein